MLTQAPKGTKDVLPAEVYKWQYIESIMRQTAYNYGYKEIRTPVFEHTELFLRSVGNTTDVVQKEMYTFNDKGNRSITLKPEGTAPAVRAFIEHGLYNQALPLKTYYFTPVFRYERPQAGRLREHHQFGVEVFGAPEPSLDAELIVFATDLLSKLGLDSLEVEINSIGCPECRRAYNQAFLAFLNEKKDGLCGTCLERIDKNPLRVLDCKVKSCNEITMGAPVILDYLCDDCKNHFHKLQACLDAVNIKYSINPRIVRGLDYYVKTVFEVIYTNKNGDKLTVCGGGRYDGLTNQISNDINVTSAGFGMGMERLLMALEENNIIIPEPRPTTAYVACMGDNAKLAGFRLAKLLRAADINTEIDHTARSIKAQFKYADKLKAQFVIIIGENELVSNQYKIKNMQSGQETAVEFDQIKDYILNNRI